MKPAANAEQIVALRKFADTHGRYWKRHLGQVWETGHYGFADDSATLQTIRNTLGSSWLQSFRLPESVQS